jgi:hypothetical protein
MPSSFDIVTNVADPGVVALVAVVSMQRSSSTSLLENVLVKDNSCIVSLNEIFQNFTEQSGDAWSVDGRNLQGPVKAIEPSLLSEFLIRVAKRRCTNKLKGDTSNKCNRRCIAGFKVFPEHLSLEQHEWILKHTPGLIPVVLERDAEARWKSRYVAAATEDWDTTGSLEHKKKIREMNIPLINACESDEFCNSKDWRWKQLCHFESQHNEWYEFIRKTLSPDKRVELSFDEAVLLDGKDAKNKIAEALPPGFRHLL